MGEGRGRRRREEMGGEGEEGRVGEMRGGEGRGGEGRGGKDQDEWYNFI